MNTEKCKICGEIAEVFEDTGLCEECEDRHDYCCICDDWYEMNWGDECRHLFWSNHYGNTGGSGSYDGFDFAEKQLPALLDCMGTNFAEKLLEAIKKETFYFRYHGSILGPVDIEMNLGAEWSPTGFGVVEKINELMKKNEENGRLAIEGVEWLISLWAKRKDKNFYTGKANKKTVNIITKWLKNERPK